MPTISVALPPEADADGVVTAGLQAYLEPLWGAAARCDVSLYLRDDAGAVTGGIIVHSAWRWR